MNHIDFNRFNLKLVQDQPYYCIPASIQGMIQFHDPNFNIPQEEILRKITINEKYGQPSFPSAEKNAVLEFPDYDFTKIDTNNFSDWSAYIKQEIDAGFPIAISTRNEDQSIHIRIVLGYDENAKYFFLYNPGTTFMIKTDCFISMNIRAGCEIFSFEYAENRFHASLPCRDLLTIRKR
jgi:hypothetical protein